MDDLRCRYCQRDFMKRDHLFRHERIHTKEKPFVCSTCGVSFSRKDVLKRHERSQGEKCRISAITRSSNESNVIESRILRAREESSVTYPTEDGITSSIEAPAMNVPVDRFQSSEQSQQAQSSGFAQGRGEDELSNSTFMTDLSLMGNFINAFSEPSVHDSWIHLEGEANTVSTLLPIPTDLLQERERDCVSQLADSHYLASSHWSGNESTCSDLTNLNSYHGSVWQKSKKNGSDRKTAQRTHLLDAMRSVFVTNWSMDDFEMSSGIIQLSGDALFDDMSALSIHNDLACPIIVTHSVAPSLRFLGVCFDLYVEKFWPRFPIVHLPTLAPSWDNNRILFFAMALIGTLFAGTQDATDIGNRLAHRIGFLVVSKWRSVMSRHSSRMNQIVLILVQLHLQLHHLLSGSSEMLAQAINHHGSVVLWARRIGILQTFQQRYNCGASNTIPLILQPSELPRRWREWVDEESSRRIAYAMGIIDSELSSIFGQPPLIKYSPRKGPSLASDVLFAAKTPEEWHVNASREERDEVEATKGLSSTTAILTEQEHEDPTAAKVSSSKPQKRCHWLDSIHLIEAIASEITDNRLDVPDTPDEWNDLLDEQLLQRLTACLPPLSTDKTLSSQDQIRNSIVDAKHLDIPDELVEANILWHSTVISLLIDIQLLEQYHGRDGSEIAKAVCLTVPPKTVVSLVLHALVIRSLAQRYSLQRCPLSIFVARCLLNAAMVLNWYEDQRNTMFTPQMNKNEDPGSRSEIAESDVANPGTFGIDFNDWINEVNQTDPFTLLIREQPSRERIQQMLNDESSISQMTRAIKGTNFVDGRYNNFIKCLEVLAGNEMNILRERAW